MKKVDVLNGLNDMVDNTCGEKLIFDGCKYCMAVNGVKCSEAAKLFDDKCVLSPYLPYFYSIETHVYDYFKDMRSPLDLPCFSSSISHPYNLGKPLSFPLRCFHDCNFEVYGCENCNIAYKPRYDGKGCYDKSCPICGVLPDYWIKEHRWGNEYFYFNQYYLNPLYCHNCGIVYIERYNIESRIVQYNNKCPHCGEVGDYLQDITENIYFHRPQVEIEMDEERLETMYYNEYPGFICEEAWVDEWTEDIFKNIPMSENDIKEALALAESIFGWKFQISSNDDFRG